MRFSIVSLLLWAALSIPAVAQTQGEPGGLVPETTAMRHGLTRTWFAQADINPQSARIATITLHHNTIFVTSDHGLVQAWHAETGAKLWSEQLGNGLHPTSAVGASETIAAVTYGSYLHLFEVATGKSLGKRTLGGVPAAICCCAWTFCSAWSKLFSMMVSVIPWRAASSLAPRTHSAR